MTKFTDIPYFQNIQDIVKAGRIDAFLVGGFLRDILLGRASRDYDFATEKNALAVARRFSQKIRGAYVLLDEERGCARVVKKIRGQAHTYDFADYREETFLKDLSHRDFTLNTLSVDILKARPSDEIIPRICDHKKGIKDIKAKRIKMVSRRVFREDPLRTLRAFSLRASLKFQIEAKTLEQIQKDKDLLCGVSFERISVELFKILETDNASVVIRQMDQVKLIDRILPQVAGMFQCKQGLYHHLDVWKHSLETVRQQEKIFKDFSSNADIRAYLQQSLGGNRSRKALIKLGALLHDVGKPDTRKIEKGKYSFHAHEHVGQRIVKSIARTLKLSTRERHALEDMVQMHLRPGYLSNYKRPTERAIYRFFRDAGEEAVSILLLSLADQRSTRGPLTTEKDQAHHENICRSLIERFFVKQKEEPFIRLITGHDVMKKLKIGACATVGQILAEVEERQTLGKVRTKSEALKAVQEIFQKIKEKS